MALPEGRDDVSGGSERKNQLESGPEYGAIEAVMDDCNG